MSGSRAKAVRREMRRQGLDPFEPATLKTRGGKLRNFPTRHSAGRSRYRTVKRMVQAGGQ